MSTRIPAIATPGTRPGEHGDAEGDGDEVEHRLGHEQFFESGREGDRFGRGVPVGPDHREEPPGQEDGAADDVQEPEERLDHPGQDTGDDAREDPGGGEGDPDDDQEQRAPVLSHRGLAQGQHLDGHDHHQQAELTVRGVGDHPQVDREEEKPEKDQ